MSSRRRPITPEQRAAKVDALMERLNGAISAVTEC